MPSSSKHALRTSATSAVVLCLMAGPMHAQADLARNYSDCVGSIPALARVARDGGVKDGVRIRIADVNLPVTGDEHVVVAGDAPMRWASIEFARPKSSAKRDIQLGAVGPFGFLFRCAGAPEAEGSDIWLEPTIARLLRSPGKTTRVIGPRLVTLSYVSGAATMILRIDPRKP